MKSLLTILTSLLLFPSIDNVALKSQIKWKCDPSWKKIEREEERQFDSKRNLVKWIQYTSSGSICDHFKYDYNAGRKIKEYRKNCSQSFDAATITTFKYGANNRIEEENVIENNKLTKISKFKYKSDRDRYAYLREDYFDGEKEPTTIANLKYDKDGNLLEEEQIVSGSWFGTYTYKFNSRGQLIYETGSVDGGVGIVEYFYVYHNDLLVKDSVKIPDDETEYHIYETKDY
jgi:hypothetical protein